MKNQSLFNQFLKGEIAIDCTGNYDSMKLLTIFRLAFPNERIMWQSNCNYYYIYKGIKIIANSDTPPLGKKVAKLNDFFTT